MKTLDVDAVAGGWPRGPASSPFLFPFDSEDTPAGRQLHPQCEEKGGLTSEEPHHRCGWARPRTSPVPPTPARAKLSRYRPGFGRRPFSPGSEVCRSLPRRDGASKLGAPEASAGRAERGARRLRTRSQARRPPAAWSRARDARSRHTHGQEAGPRRLRREAPG